MKGGAPRPGAGSLPWARASRDFYAELIQESQTEPARLAERERWLRSVRSDGREELLFEFEMLLRAVERYFNLHNLWVDGAGEPIIARDFREELSDVRDALDQGIRLARRLMDPDSDQRMLFRRYVEAQLLDDRIRRALLEEELGQDSPAQSLFLLRQGFESLRTVVDHLLKLDAIPLGVFQEVGNLALKEMVLNAYFRPFRPLEFRIEYDRVRSVPVLEALERLALPERRLFTVALLCLFRVLHYLGYVGSEPGRPPERRARVILALVRSELVTLVGYARVELAVKLSHKRHQAAALKVARELQSQVRRIARAMLDKEQADPEAPRAAAAAFGELVRKEIVLLAQVLDVRVSGDDAFLRLVSPAQMGQRLRTDLWVFAQLCRLAEAALAGPPGRAADEAWSALLRFIQSFQAVGYQLLRYGDFEPFDRFTAIAVELPRCPEGPLSRARLAEDLHLFGQVLESAFTAVSRRAELSGKKFDLHRAESILAEFRAP